MLVATDSTTTTRAARERVVMHRLASDAAVAAAVQTGLLSAAHMEEWCQGGTWRETRTGELVRGCACPPAAALRSVLQHRTAPVHSPAATAADVRDAARREEEASSLCAIAAAAVRAIVGQSAVVVGANCYYTRGA